MSEKLHSIVNESENCIPEKEMRDYISGTLSPGEMHRVEKHTVDCELCSDALEGLSLMKDKGRIALLATQVEKMLGKEEKRGPVILWLQNNFKYAAAAAILLVVCATFVLKNALKENPEPSLSDMVKSKETLPEADKVVTIPPDEKSVTSPSTNDERSVASENKNTTVRQEIKGEGVPRANRILPPTAPQMASGEEKKNVIVSSEMDEPNVANEMISMQKAEEKISSHSGAMPEPAAPASAPVVSENQARDKAEIKKPELSKKAKEFEARTLDEKVAVTNAYSKAEDDRHGAGIITDCLPEFAGGDTARYNYIKKNIKYPAIVQNKNISGTVYIGFIIEADGSVSNVKLLRGINDCKECDEEAIRVVKAMPRWNPGKSAGMMGAGASIVTV